MFEVRSQQRPDDLGWIDAIGEHNSFTVAECLTPEQAIREAVSRAVPSFPMFVIGPNGQRIFSVER